MCKFKYSVFALSEFKKKKLYLFLCFEGANNTSFPIAFTGSESCKKGSKQCCCIFTQIEIAKCSGKGHLNKHIRLISRLLQYIIIKMDLYNMLMLSLLCM